MQSTIRSDGQRQPLKAQFIYFQVKVGLQTLNQLVKNKWISYYEGMPWNEETYHLEIHSKKADITGPELFLKYPVSILQTF